MTFYARFWLTFIMEEKYAKHIRKEQAYDWHIAGELILSHQINSIEQYNKNECLIKFICLMPDFNIF